MEWIVSVALAVGLIAGFVLSKFVGPQHSATKASIPKKSDNTENSNNSKNQKKKEEPYTGEDYKMVLVVRNDLAMGKGKIAAQCSHATLGAFKKAQKKDQRGLDAWEEAGQAKVVVKVQDEDEMLALEEEARKAKLITYIVIDAGKTQIASGTSTVLAVGPGPRSTVDSVTGKLKLM